MERYDGREAVRQSAAPPFNAGMPLAMPEAQAYAYQDVRSSMNTIVGTQIQIESQIAAMDYQVSKTLQMVRKSHRKLLESKIVMARDEQIRLLYKYSDGSEEAVRLIDNAKGAIEIIKIDFKREACSFYAIKFPDSGITVIGEMQSLNPQRLRDAFVRAGIQFNPQIAVRVIEKALYYSFAPQIENCKRIVKNSGLAGWDGECFLDAGRLERFERFKPKLRLPVLEKHFNRMDFIPVHVQNYAKLMTKIHNLEVRALFSLLPFAAIMKSLFLKGKIDVPIAVNLILTADDIGVKDIAEYLQIFNREENKVLNVDVSTKDILRSMTEAKDEILLFSGRASSVQTNYKNNKISKNFHMIAEICMGINGVNYGENEFMASIVCISNQRICVKGVKNVFIDEETMDKEEALENSKEREALSRSVDAVLAGFVAYIEEHMPEVMWRMSEDYQVKTKAERYWRTVFSITDDFWRSKNDTLYGVLGLPEEFPLDFLWHEDTGYMDDGVEMLISAFRRKMPDLKVTAKSNRKDAECIYDEESIWIRQELLDDVLVHSGIKAYKNAILLECQERGILQTNPYGGYTTRLQIGSVRKEYYCFQRSSFNSVGLAEIVSLGREDEC